MIVVSLCLVSSASASVLWEETFSEVPLGPAQDQTPENVIAEEGALRFLSKQDSQTEFYFAKLKGAISPETWIDTLTKVRFRFAEKCTTTIVVKSIGDRGDVPYGWYYVSIGSTGVGIECKNMSAEDAVTYASDPRTSQSVVFNDTSFGDLVAGTWITASVFSGQEVLKLRLQKEDGTIGEWEFKVFPGTGSSRLLLRSPTDIDEFVVEQVDEVVPTK